MCFGNNPDMFVYFYPTFFYFSLILLALTLTFLRARGRSLYQILFSAIFGFYLIGAISVAVFPFSVEPSHTGFRLNLNLIPFNFGRCFDYLPQNCAKDIINNILLTVPFGFLIQFIVSIRPERIAWRLVAIGCSFEFTQLIMAVVFRTGSRSIDINDILFNTAGAFIGYGVFRIIGWFYLLAIKRLDLQPRQIFAHIHEAITPHFSD